MNDEIEEEKVNLGVREEEEEERHGRFGEFMNEILVDEIDMQRLYQ